MNHKSKTILGGIALVLGAVLLSGCTKNFCNSEDKSNMLYPYEQGVTVYCDKDTYDKVLPTLTETQKSLSGLAIDFTGSDGTVYHNDNVYKYVAYEYTSAGVLKFSAKKASDVNAIISSAASSNYIIPSVQYFAKIDQLTLETAIEAAKKEDLSFNASSVVATYASVPEENDSSVPSWVVNPFTEADTNGKTGDVIAIDYSLKHNSLLRCFGALKFQNLDKGSYKSEFIEENEFKSGNGSRLYSWVKTLRLSTEAGLGLDGVANDDFFGTYRTRVLSNISSRRSCIATKDGLAYGHYGDAKNWEVKISKKSWSYAWGLNGFPLLEGVLVYPIAWMVDSFAVSMEPALTGVGQIWAIVLVTLIVRVALFLITLPSQISQQKIQALQPQLAKIQAKYPNANTNQAEKMRMSQETQALYKRNHVSMWSPFLAMLIQFPVFICVWDALNGSAVLSTGSFLNMRLSDSIREIIFDGSAWAHNQGGAITALVLFILMAAGQFLSVFVPQLISKKARKKVAKMYDNPAENKQSSTSKLMTWGMFAFTLVMGFFLPSAMGVYWLIGSIISLAQTLIVQAVINRKNAKKRSH